MIDWLMIIVLFLFISVLIIFGISVINEEFEIWTEYYTRNIHKYSMEKQPFFSRSFLHQHAVRISYPIFVVAAILVAFNTLALMDAFGQSFEKDHRLILWVTLITLALIALTSFWVLFHYLCNVFHKLRSHP